jgi:hypothetical protein
LFEHDRVGKPVATFPDRAQEASFLPPTQIFYEHIVDNHNRSAKGKARANKRKSLAAAWNLSETAEMPSSIALGRIPVQK